MREAGSWQLASLFLVAAVRPRRTWSVRPVPTVGTVSVAHRRLREPHQHPSTSNDEPTSRLSPMPPYTPGSAVTSRAVVSMETTEFERAPDCSRRRLERSDEPWAAPTTATARSAARAAKPGRDGLEHHLCRSCLPGRVGLCDQHPVRPRERVRFVRLADQRWASATRGGGGVGAQRDRSAAASGRARRRWRMRPGDTLKLQLSMSVFAGAGISGWHNSGFLSAHVLADADFSHTLLWDEHHRHHRLRCAR